MVAAKYSGVGKLIPLEVIAQETWSIYPTLPCVNRSQSWGFSDGIFGTGTGTKPAPFREPIVDIITTGHGRYSEWIVKLAVCLDQTSTTHIFPSDQHSNILKVSGPDQQVEVRNNKTK